MSATHRHHTSAVWRVALAATGACLVLLAAPRSASAQPAIVGYLSNFDVPNDVKDVHGDPRETEGFEIQIEGVQPADVIYAFGEAGPLSGPLAPCYIRYCRPQIIPYATGVYVRWQARWDPIAHQFTSNFNIPGLVLTSAGTPPIASGVFFAGHQCWSMGLGGLYPQGGCEHFGVSLQKAPGQTTYRWLVPELDTNGLPTGVLTYDGGAPLGSGTPPPAAVKSVPILVPVVQVPAAGQVNAGEVQAVIKSPPPAPQPPGALPHRYGLAQWVKVYKKEVPRQADLDELVGGHRNENVPGIAGQDRDANAAAETEWKLLQLDVRNPDKGGSQLVNHGSSGSNSHSVVRRYEFYKYAGPVVPPGGTSGGGKGGGAVFSTDDQVACVTDPVTLECPAPRPGELGDFIGAQNVAQNLNLHDGRTPQTIAFAALADLTYPHGALTLNATTSSNLAVTFGAIGACSVVGNTLSVDGAGGCVVTASQLGDATFAPASDVLRGFIIDKGTQTISFALPAGPFTYGDAPFQVSATSSAGLPVAFVGSGACTAQDKTVTISGAGLCEVTASQAGDANYASAPDVVQATAIAKAAATVSFDAGTLAQIYDGSVKTVGTTTAPPFLSVKLSFTGAPQNAGSYPVTATIDDVNYEGTASDTLDIAKAAATVALSDLTQTYTGGALTPTATTTPAGLSLVWTGAPDTDAGSYPVTATVTDPNYDGSASGTFVINPPASANPIVNPGPQTSYEGDEVELRIRVVGVRSSSGKGDDDRRPRGSFAAKDLPPALRIEKEQGVIRGHLKKDTASQYDVTVMYTENGVTFSQSFRWTVLKGKSKDEQSKAEHSRNERN